MKINHISKSKNYLYEGLDQSSLRSIKLWESAGSKICEAELTVDQISKLFAQVQQDATAAGSNRTMIGKGKDAADAVGKAWEDLKTKVQNSGPIKNVDAQYDKAAEKLKQATGGDAGVMKYVEKYRAFAKAHPIAQSLIYAALIAAAGISGAGAGGAAALGLLKMTDKLLQGEKFSSAAYSGAKTGVAAYAAGQIGQAMKGQPDAPASPDARPETGYGSKEWSDARDRMMQDRIASSQADANQAKELAQKMGIDASKKLSYNSTGGIPTTINGVRVPTNLYSPDQLSKIDAAKAMQGITQRIKESQIKRMFYVAGTLQDKLTEGVWDKVKGAASKAAGAVANKAQTVGTNLTTKVTADKLMSAWKRAGSPTDSDAVAAIMKQAGVDDAIIASSINAVGGQSVPTNTTAAPTNTTAAPTAPTNTTATPTAAAPVDAQTQNFIQQLVASYAALTPEEKAQLKKELQDAVTASDVGSNVVKATNESKKLSKRVR
jgi:hypothetical protein